MSRLSEDIVATIDIVDVISRYVNLKRVGRNFVGLSPFRNEKTPSFTVSPEKQIFKCFSTWIGGNVIKFLMEIERIDYRDAAQMLAKEANIDVQQYQTKRTTNPEKREKEGEEKEKYKRMLRLADEYFVKELSTSASSQQYLREKRHLTDDVIRQWGLWYAPDTMFGLTKILLQKWFSETDCISIWLARKKEGWDLYGFYRNRIMFPIHDHMGNIVWFGARAIDPNDQPKYLNSSDSPLYDKSRVLYGLDKVKNTLREHDAIVVVEGYMDVIWFSRIWLPIAVATCGTSLTPNHMKLLKRYTSNIYFLFDNDPAGIQASQRALKVAYQHDLYPKMITLPDGYKDIDEWANTNPSSDAVQWLLSSAIDGFQWMIHTIIQANDMWNPVERKRFLQTVFDMLLYIQDFSILSWYLEAVAKKVSMSYDIIFSQFKTFTKSQTVTVAHIRKDQESQQKVQKESDTMLFNAFFYNTFLLDNGIHDQTLDDAMMLVVELAGVIGDDMLVKVVSGDVEESIQHDLAQAQLWREKHWWEIGPEKKLPEIKRHCHTYLQNALKVIIKMQTLSAWEKQDITKRVQEIMAKK